MNCTSVTQQISNLFGFDLEQGEAYLQTTPPGAGGLTFLPHLNGERTPDLPFAKGMLGGLDVHNMTPAHIYRAAMEGVTYSLKYGHDLFEHAGMEFGRVVLTGGGANSPSWRQLVADIFGLPVEVPQIGESAAFGAGLQALWALRLSQGERVTIADVTKEHVAMNPTLTATPDASKVQAYLQAYRRFGHHLKRIEHDSRQT